MPFIQNALFSLMTTKNKTIFAGLIMMAAMLSVSFTYTTAFAQESDLRIERADRPIHIGTFLVGNGAAVGEDDSGWRSHFKMGIVESESNDSGHTQYEVKRGVFAVGKHNERHLYSVISDTWEVSVSPNMKSFDASGKVENQEGKVYDVEISGDEISDLQHGTLYYVSGTATGSDGEEYDLFYISALVEKTPSTQATTSGI